MKAADARRQSLLERKRLRQLESYNEDDVRCHLAERLLNAYDAGIQANPTKTSILASNEEIARLETSLATLDDLKSWIDRLVEMQMMWVDCSARLDSGTAVRMWYRMDRFMRRVARQPDSTQQLALVHAKLPALVEKARKLVALQQPHVAFASTPLAAVETASRANSYQPLAGGAMSDPLIVRDPVELPHQWLPPVVLDICESIEREYAAGRCRPALVDAMRKLRCVVRDRNPYAFLSVLYRPPPLIDATNETGATGSTNHYILFASQQTNAIAELLHAHFNEMHHFAWWMESPDATFWKTFKRFMYCVRRVAIAFHRVMIHLYATAMQRHESYVTPRDVAAEIDAAYAAHMDRTLQSDGYGLAQWFETASDAIHLETYALFPEVLVYADQWRHEFSIYEHGFAPTERARNYEVNFRKWRSSKTWLEIAHRAQCAAHTWHRSRLGTRNFRPMTFEQLGQLETEIKGHLATITDLLYKQNLAKWSQQRSQFSRARGLVELQIMAQDSGLQMSNTAPMVETDPSSSSHNRRGYDQQKRFRPPTRSRTVLQKTKADAASTVTNESIAISVIDEEVILKWTDDEIDSHEQETEQLYELQGGMLAASDSLALPLLFSDESEDYSSGALDAKAAARGLYASCRKLDALTRRIVTHGEKIAFHGAADALIQRPSLRIPQTSPLDNSKNTNGDESQHQVDKVPSAETLEIAVRETALGFLNLHQAATADPDTQESVQKLALEALKLLRSVQGQVA